MKKYFAEFIGTFILVFFGCGAAVVLGGIKGGMGLGYLGVLAIALAFGLAIVAGAYSIGSISGCHVNPAVSLGFLINGKLSVIDFFGYVVAQVAGAFAGSSLLYFFNKTSDIHGFGANGYGELSAVSLNLTGALIAETVLTFIFVFLILNVTSSEKFSSVVGLVIGLSLTLIHLVSIPLTGTSVNPARSLAPAVFTGGLALSQVWVFIVAPFLGAIIAAFLFKLLTAGKKAVEK